MTKPLTKKKYVVAFHLTWLHRPIITRPDNDAKRPGRGPGERLIGVQNLITETQGFVIG